MPRLWPFRGSGESDVHVRYGIKHRAIVNEARGWPRNVEVAYSLDPGVTELDVDYLQEGEAVASARFEQSEAKTVLFRHSVRLQPGEYLYLRAVQQDGGAAWSSPFFAARDGAGR